MTTSGITLWDSMGYEAVEENLPNCFCSLQAELKLEAQDEVENEVIFKVCFSKLSVISGK